MANILSSLLWLLPFSGAPETASERASLRFEVPAECASLSEFESTLGQEHQIKLEELAGVELHLAAHSDGFLLKWRDQATQRQFEDPDCRTLFRTAIVIAASFVHPEATAASEPLGDPDEPASDPASAPATMDAEGEPAAPPTEDALLRAETPTAGPSGSASAQGDGATSAAVGRPWSLRRELSVGAGIRFGLAPSVGILVEGEAALLFGPFGLSAGVGYAPRTTHFLKDVGVRLESWLFQLQAALRPLDRLRMDLGLQAAWVIGQSSNVSGPARDGVWLLAPRLDAAVAVAQHRVVDLEVVGSLWVAVNAPRFEVDGVGEIYRLPRLGGAVYFRGNFTNR